MSGFSLTHEEFKTVATFLNAVTIPGLNVDLSSVDERAAQVGLEQLKEHGHFTPGEGDNTWHPNDELWDAMLVVIAPARVVLIRDITAKRSFQFFLADTSVVSVVVTDELVVVTPHASIVEIPAIGVEFLEKAEAAEIASAYVYGAELINGERLEVASGVITTSDHAGPLTQDAVLKFLFPPAEEAESSPAVGAGEPTE